MLKQPQRESRDVGEIGTSAFRTADTADGNVWKTDETASTQELSKCLRRIFAVNLRSSFSEIDGY